MTESQRYPVTAEWQIYRDMIPYSARITASLWVPENSLQVITFMALHNPSFCYRLEMQNASWYTPEWVHATAWLYEPGGFTLGRMIPIMFYGEPRETPSLVHFPPSETYTQDGRTTSGVEVYSLSVRTVSRETPWVRS